MSTPIEKLRNLCLERGVHGIVSIGRMFRVMDENRSRTLDHEELKYGIAEFGLKMSNAEVDELFRYLDKEHSGSITFDEFLLALRPPMSKARLEMIDKAFIKMDATGDGVITIEDLKRNYNVTHHPKYQSGEMSEDQILHEFLNNFQVGGTLDETVTKDEFINYYAGVSSSIDDDEYFVFMMHQAWKL